jgi:hypothetical protein
MSVELVDEQDLRDALRPFRTDPSAFEVAVRERMRVQQSSGELDPLNELPPAVRAAAAFLPLQLLAGGKVSSAAPTLAGSQKLLAILAFPAISLFVLLGATIFSVTRIRGARNDSAAEPRGQKEMQKAVQDWWHDHRFGARLVFGLLLGLMIFGASGLLFLLLIVSLGLLAYVVHGLARVGLGNRQVVAGSCLTALLLLGQCTSSLGIGDGSIHFLDQKLVSVVFWLGVLAMTPFIAMYPSLHENRFRGAAQRSTSVFLLVILVPLIAWLSSSVLWPATPARIKSYVESFDRAPNSSASWREWEIPARWAVESGLNPDLSTPRRLLDAEIAGEQNPFILSSAFRVGLVRREQVSSLRDLASSRLQLLGDLKPIVATQQITSIEQADWAIRALVLNNELTAPERDFLAARLHVTLRALADSPFDILRDSLVATRLLAVVDRAVDPAMYRQQIHSALRSRHRTGWGAFQRTGGFRQFGSLSHCDAESTEFAVELMETYGVPDGLDLNWVRSYARPQALGLPGRWTSAVTRNRLNDLPGAQRPTWWQMLYYERNMLAALVLVGLCIFAAASSPSPRAINSDEPTPPAEGHCF